MKLTKEEKQWIDGELAPHNLSLKKLDVLTNSAIEIVFRAGTYWHHNNDHEYPLTVPQMTLRDVFVGYEVQIWKADNDNEGDEVVIYLKTECESLFLLNYKLCFYNGYPPFFAELKALKKKWEVSVQIKFLV